MTVFISHDFDDKALFYNIADALEQVEVPFFNPYEMLAGRSLPEMLHQSIGESDLCIFIATQNSVDSNWCSAELGAFWGAGKKVIIYIADTSLDLDKLPEQFKGHLFEKRITKVVSAVKHYLTEEIQTEQQKEPVKIFENQLKANMHIIDIITSANPPIKKATVLQYSSQAVREVVEELLNANVSVDLFLKNPKDDVSELQKGNIDKTIATYHNLFGTNEEICNNLLKVFLYDDTGSIRAIRLDDNILAIGYYVYEDKSIYGHNQPLFLCDSNDSQSDSVFNKFNQYIERQIKKAKQIDIREYTNKSSMA